MESVLMTHHEEVVPFMVRDFDLLDGKQQVLASIRGHRGARFEHVFESAPMTGSLVLRVLATHGSPAAVFRVRVFGG